jgi:hypothetical protein
LVKALRHQCLDTGLSSRPPDRGHARIPAGAELDVRWQARVDEALGIGDGPFVESGNSGGQRFDERV